MSLVRSLVAGLLARRSAAVWDMSVMTHKAILEGWLEDC